MGVIELLLLSAALSIDALTIGISCGLKRIGTPWKAKIIICTVSFVVTAGAVVGGNWLSCIVSEEFGRVLGSALLGLLGGYMLVSAVRNKEPVECDINHSANIEATEALWMGLALSADSFSAGISAGIGKGWLMLVPVMCSIFQMLFLCFGEYFAKKIVCTSRIRQAYFSVAAGIILLLTAVSRLLIH